jgi:urease accessory protein
MTGHLDLVCGLNSKGESHLRSQSFRAPMHISKPHLDGATLVVNAVNPTAGLFEGDKITCNIRVESGSSMLFTSPSASRAHRMNGGGEAFLQQHFFVENGGWLEVFPELFIPQKGSRYRQKTVVEIAEDGGLLFFETLAPGRVASGEVFQFQHLDWETEIFYAGTRVVREKYRITPSNLTAMRGVFPTAYYACIFLFHPSLKAANPCWQAISALHGENAWVGNSRLHGAGWSIKILASDSVQLRKTIHAIRRIVHEATGRMPMPELRKN